VSDPRFSANYEKVRSGMAQYLCEAIEANRGAPHDTSAGASAELGEG
jgi:hypothetical protein